MKLSEASRLFLEIKLSEGYSTYTTKSYGYTYAVLAKEIGDVEIEEITLHMLRTHIQSESIRLKPSSVRHKVRGLKSFFSWLADEEYVAKNPAKKLREPKEEPRIPKALSVEEMEFLRDSCKTTMEHALVEFFFATGCRIGEVHKLNRSDIDWDQKCARVIGKGNRPREVYFGARSAIWLKRYLEERKDDDEALFVTLKSPHRPTIHHIEVWFKAIAKRCGLEGKAHPHAFRHTFATTILNNGADLHIVQNLMGHQKPSTTLLYTAVSGEARRQAYSKYFMQ